MDLSEVRAGFDDFLKKQLWIMNGTVIVLVIIGGLIIISGLYYIQLMLLIIPLIFVYLFSVIIMAVIMYSKTKEHLAIFLKKVKEVYGDKVFPTRYVYIYTMKGDKETVLLSLQNMLKHLRIKSKKKGFKVTAEKELFAWGWFKYVPRKRSVLSKNSLSQAVMWIEAEVLHTVHGKSEVYLILGITNNINDQAYPAYVYDTYQQLKKQLPQGREKLEGRSLF